MYFCLVGCFIVSFLHLKTFGGIMTSSAMDRMDGKDRRRHTRVDFATKIVINIGGTEIQAEGNSKDLSLKGVFVTTDKKLPVGTKCSVKIFLSGGVEDIELNMDAYVARVEEDGLGLAFGSMDLDSYTYLRNVMRYNTDDFDEI